MQYRITLFLLSKEYLPPIGRFPSFYLYLVVGYPHPSRAPGCAAGGEQSSQPLFSRALSPSENFLGYYGSRRSPVSVFIPFSLWLAGTLVAPNEPCFLAVMLL